MARRWMVKMAAVCVAVMGVAWSAGAQSYQTDDGGLPRITVYVTGGVPENEKKVLGARLLTALAKSGSYKAAEQADAFFAEAERQTKQRGDVVDYNQICRIGKQFGTEYVCIANAVPIFGEYNLAIRILDANTVKIAFIGESHGPMRTMDELARIVDAAVSSMFGVPARPQPRPAPSAAAAPASQTEPAAESFTDPRDGKVYHTVKIGVKTWIAENLKSPPPTGNSWCYDDNPSNCDKYGRLYDWDAAMAACPAGWRLPDRRDLRDLVENAGSNIAGMQLKSRTAWNGTDNFGWAALPGGGRNGEGVFSNLGTTGAWWTSAEDEKGAYIGLMSSSQNGVGLTVNNKILGFSVRCVNRTALPAPSAQAPSYTDSAVYAPPQAISMQQGDMRLEPAPPAIQTPPPAPAMALPPGTKPDIGIYITSGGSGGMVAKMVTPLIANGLVKALSGSGKINSANRTDDINRVLGGQPSGDLSPGQMKTVADQLNVHFLCVAKISFSGSGSFGMEIQLLNTAAGRKITSLDLANLDKSKIPTVMFDIARELLKTVTEMTGTTAAAPAPAAAPVQAAVGTRTAQPQPYYGYLPEDTYTSQNKGRNTKMYFSSRYILPITEGAKRYTLVEEFGWIWQKDFWRNDFFLGIEAAYGYLGGGGGLNLGGVARSKDGIVQFAYGGFVGYWGVSDYDSDYRPIEKFGFIGPFARLRLSVFEVSYRAIIGGRTDVRSTYYENYGSKKLGAINQFMFGLHFEW